jgi:hypothetical protein
MKRLLLNVAALAAIIVISGTALAGGHHQGNKHVSYNNHPSKNLNYKSGPHGYDYKFKKGFDYKGYCHNWSYSCWSPKYHCYCYYCPSSCLWYYWNETSCCYYPVTYLTPVTTVAVTTPVIVPVLTTVPAVTALATTAPASVSPAVATNGPPQAP